MKVTLAELLADDTDADLDTLTISAVGSALPAGAGVTLSGNWVFYTRAPGSMDPGSFTYTVSDGRGGEDTATVTVNIKTDSAQSQNIADIADLGGGTFRITFRGIPGRTYTVQYTENLDPPNTVWSTLGTAPVNALGIGTFDDSAGSPSRFYRTVYP